MFAWSLSWCFLLCGAFYGVDREALIFMYSGIEWYKTARNMEWFTPKYIIDALGSFDLDPCTIQDRPWDTAASYYTKEDDGLSKLWEGRVWLNPPYGKETGRWLERLALHGNGIALIFCRTETKMWFDHVWNDANGILFLQGRLFFCRPDGSAPLFNSGAPSCLIAYGRENLVALQRCGLPGKLVTLR
jgi:hypothetical protein